MQLYYSTDEGLGGEIETPYKTPAFIAAHLEGLSNAEQIRNGGDNIGVHYKHSRVFRARLTKGVKMHTRNRAHTLRDLLYH